MFNIYFEESSFTTIEINSAKMSTFTIKFFFVFQTLSYLSVNFKYIGRKIYYTPILS